MPLQIVRFEDNKDEGQDSSNKKSKSNKSKSRSRSKSRSYKRSIFDNATIMEDIRSIRQSLFEDSEEGIKSPSVKMREEALKKMQATTFDFKDSQFYKKKLNQDLLYRYLKSKETSVKKFQFQKLFQRRMMLEQKYNSLDRLQRKDSKADEAMLLTLSNTNKSKSTLKTTACTVQDKIAFNREKVMKVVDNPYVTKKTNILSSKSRFSQVSRIETDPKKSKYLFSVSSCSLNRTQDGSFRGFGQSRSGTPMLRLGKKRSLSRKRVLSDAIQKNIKRRDIGTISKRRRSVHTKMGKKSFCKASTITLTKDK
ncbi:unnamed protein product [Moneuplotes crassus]|uniref:Uncharacterized protein n=1 Tax=Euplotes crassus TaxID=5936 RepID=A0AAD1X4A0_EUPCR|nr:unnamed protein product [Moneuplotes crassus]